MKKKISGFTLVEIIVVLVILALLSAFLIPTLMGFVTNSKTKLCLINRMDMMRLYQTFVFENKDQISNDKFSEFVKNNWDVECPSGGTYTYIAKVDTDGSITTDIICSIHGSVNEDPLTLFGNTFSEISDGLITTIQTYFHNNGYYGRSWGSYRYTDIGLNPDDWDKPIDHIYYKPSGNRVLIRPEDGYQLIVTNESGIEKTITARSNWVLVYDDLSKAWYYRSISDENRIDINSLRIEN